MNNEKTITYSPGLFDKFKSTDIDYWDDFPDLMWGLGFKMDCGHGFQEYCKTDKYAKACKKPKGRREKFKNELYILEHADRQIVGNYLFSYYRYLTHWAFAFDKYDVDFLKRMIVILESKYNEKV